MLSDRVQSVSPSLGASIPFVALGLYLVTSIFYIFPSGNPQPADFLLILGFILTLLLMRGTLPKEPALYSTLGLFLAWIVLVNGFWFMTTGSGEFLKKTSFYIYNAIVLVFVASIGYYDFDKLKKTVWVSCIIVLVAQVSYLEIAATVGKRAIGTFNNPNQMGYWALLVMTCLVVARERTRLGVVDVLALGAGLYATMLSLSKAALISSVLVFALAVVGCGLRRRAGWLLGTVLVAGLFLQWSTGNLAERVMTLDPVVAVMRDLSAIEDEGQEDIEQRGYQRLVRFPHYLILGAGEGEFARFGTGGRTETGQTDREFHSSLGNLLLSYGAVGLLLFAALLAVIFVGAPWASVAYLLPVMLYGITHNGLRFSLFWVFLGMVFAQSHYGTERAIPHGSAVGYRASEAGHPTRRTG